MKWKDEKLIHFQLHHNILLGGDLEGLERLLQLGRTWEGGIKSTIYINWFFISNKDIECVNKL